MIKPGPSMDPWGTPHVRRFGNTIVHPVSVSEMRFKAFIGVKYQSSFSSTNQNFDASIFNSVHLLHCLDNIYHFCVHVFYTFPFSCSGWEWSHSRGATEWSKRGSGRRGVPSRLKAAPAGDPGWDDQGLPAPRRWRPRIRGQLAQHH